MVMVLFIGVYLFLAVHYRITALMCLNFVKI